MRHRIPHTLLSVLSAAFLSVGLLSGCAKSNAATSASDQSSASGLTVTCLNVGKADAILLQENGTNVLIDTGTAAGAESLVASLEDLQVDTIDTLILTHFDQDHVGGAAAILSTFQTSQVFTTYQSKTSEEIDAYEAAMADAGLTQTLVSENTTFTIGDVTYTIYPPLETEYKNDTSNNSSLVTYVTYGSDTFLFCGDIQKNRLKELLDQDLSLQAEFIKMPHHGTYEKNLEELISVVDPQYAVISTGTEQLPDPETTEILDLAGITTYMTYNGNVTIHTEGNGLSISQ